MQFSEEEAEQISLENVDSFLKRLVPYTKDHISWWLHFCLEDKLSIDKRKEIAYDFGSRPNVDIDLVLKELKSYETRWQVKFDIVKDCFWRGVSENISVTDKLYEKVYINNGIKYLISKENLPDELVNKITMVHGENILMYNPDQISDKIKNALLNSEIFSKRANRVFRIEEFNPFFDNKKPEVNKALTDSLKNEPQQKDTTEEKVKDPNTFNKIKDIVISEIPEVTVRISARQFVKLACAPIQGLCIRYDAHKANMFMHTAYGKSLISLISSESLKFVQLENPNHNHIKNAVAKELRVQAITGVGNEILDTLRPIVFDALKSVLSDKPKNQVVENKTNLLEDGSLLNMATKVQTEDKLKTNS